VSTRVVALTSSLSTAPGDVALGRVEIHNDGSADAVYRVDVVGIDITAVDENVPTRTVSIPVAAGSSSIAEVPISIPRSLGIGEHAAAFEVTSDRPADRPALCPFTLSIASVARVDLEPQPSTIRGRRRAKFQVDVTNHEPQVVAVTLDAEATDVAVQFGVDAFSLAPGQRAVAKAKLKGPRHWAGEPTQHNIVITARGRASSTSTTAAYIQRPLFAHKLRMAVVALTVIALWLGAIGGVAFWLANRTDDAGPTSAELIGVDTDGDGITDSFFDADGNPVTGTDTDGDGIPDAFVDANGNPVTGTDTDGDGIPDTLVDADGNPLEAVDTDGDGVPDGLSDGSADQVVADGDEEPAVPSSTVLRGTVQAQGDPDDISITLAPIELGEQPSAQTAALGFAGGGAAADGGKLWPVRYGRIDASTGPVRQTEAVAPLQITPDTDGIWLFTDVAVRQTYELVFTKPGFDTQSFVITPPEDGSPIELDVELVPASGSVSGRVTGPGGALGGVAIVVSDGTLTFETTSATDGDIGSWSLEGLSTPGVYTMTATLRGYGTETIQIDLGAGDERTGVNLAMRPGVGSVSGRVVGETGQPLPGATITATNGETTLSTSTLTEGAVGTFNLPQLDVPLTYTVKVELDGYITQTRRVPLNGALGGVDFVMNRTTLRLTGQVNSSEGGGIPSAGVILSTGDLQFRTSTAVAPDAGFFSVDDLPPGVYSITFEHFQHETVTEFVTLTAGVTPSPLDVTMQTTDGPPDIGTGSLVVRVLDNDPLADPQGIVGATVTLTRNRTSDPPIVVTDPASPDVRIDDLAIGTYTVRVSAPGFNSSIPQQVSVGLNEEQRDIRLQELGQANGTVIDPISGAVLTDYQITIYEVRPIGEFLVGTFREQGGQWQTPPDVLRTGTYRVEIRPEDAPTGYLVVGDQILDPVAGKPMQFVVPTVEEATVEPVAVAPIEADPFPELSGRVFRPVLDGTTVEFQPIDDERLVAAVECNGQPVENVDIRDTAGLQDGTLFDEFFVDKGNVAKAIRDASPPYQLPASCTVTVTASDTDATTTDFEPLTFDITDVDVSNGITLSNRRVNSALVQPVGTLAGTVFWVDGNASADPPPLGERLPLAGVAIAANGVINDFAPREAPLTDTELEPTTVPSNIAVSSDASGAWSAPGQIFGQSNYTFTEAGFGPGLITVRIDESGRTVTQGSGVRLNPEGGGFAVELSPPGKGQISGDVTILTRSPDLTYPDLVETTNPFGDAPPAGDVAIDVDTNVTTNVTTATFTVTNADPGTWQARFEAPRNHQFLPLPAPPDPLPPTCELPWCVEQQVGPFPTPSTTATGFDTTLVELGALDVRLYDADDPAQTPLDIPAALAVTMISPTGSTTDPSYTGSALPESAPAEPGDTFRIEELPVSAATPTSAFVQYSLSVEVPQYDDSALKNVSFSVRAGETATLLLPVEPFGTIEGSVFGRDDADDVLTPPTGLVGLTGPETTLTAVRVTSGGTDCDGTLATGCPAADVSVSVTATSTFSFSAEPGFYRLEFENGAFDTGIPLLPVVGNLPAPTFPDPPTPTLAAGVFEMRNDADNELSPVVFDKIRGQLTISTVTALTGGTPVTGAVYDIFDTCASSATAGTAVTATPISLYPGVYCLKVNKYDPFPTKAAFPAVVTITIPDAVGGVAPTLDVITPLPELAPSIVGTIRAENTLDPAAAVALPSTPIELTSTFTSPNQIDVNGSLVDNVEDGSASATAVLSATVGEATYTFTNVPTGSHSITAPSIPGYTLVSTNPAPATATAMGPNTGPTFVYVAGRANVAFVLDDGAGGDEYPLAIDDTVRTGVSLTAPSGAIYTDYAFDDSDDGLVFFNVAPEDGDWTVSFTDALHDDVEATVVIPLDVDVDTDDDSAADARNGGTIATTANAVRISGQVREEFRPGQYRPLQTGGTVQISGAASDTFAGDGSTDDYTFDVPSLTAYSLQADQTNFEPVTTSFTPTQLGAIVTGPAIDLVQNAQVVVTVAPAVPAAPLGLRLYLAGSSAASPAVPTVNNNVYTFSVPAGSYYAQAQPVGYPTTRSPGTIAVAIGDGYETSTTAGQITLALPRLIELTVLGTSNATVALYDDLTDPPICPGTTASTSSTFTFASNVPCPGTIPETGTLNLLVSASERRTQVVQVPDVASATLSVTLRPLAQVTGTINAPDSNTLPSGQGVVEATDGTNTLTGTVTSGSYTITGLTAGTNGVSKSWTISYDQVGVGTSAAVATVDVSGTSDNSVTRNLTVTAQTLTVPFKVTEAGSSPPNNVGGATVTFAGASRDTIGNGTTTFTVPETATLTWTVAADGYYISSGTVTLGSTRTLPEQPVALTVRAPIAGTVVTGSPATAVDDATVRICPSTATSICASGTLYPDDTSSATGAYSFSADVATGSYKIFATKSTTSGSPATTTTATSSIDLVVAADRRFTLTPSTGQILLPAPS